MLHNWASFSHLIEAKVQSIKKMVPTTIRIGSMKMTVLIKNSNGDIDASSMVNTVLTQTFQNFTNRVKMYLFKMDKLFGQLCSMPGTRDNRNITHEHTNVIKAGHTCYCSPRRRGQIEQLFVKKKCVRLHQPQQIEIKIYLMQTED